jgi:hypothetical protein
MLGNSEWKKKDQDEAARLVAEFLTKGGAVKQVPLGERSEPASPKSFWGGRPKKKKSEEKPAD